MHIEVAMDAETSEAHRMTARVHIHNDLSFIRAAALYCESSRWTLRMFEAVIARTTLGLHGSNQQDQEKPPTYPAPAQEVPPLPSANAVPAPANIFCPGTQQQHYDVQFLGTGDPTILDAAGRNQEEWMNEMFGINFWEANGQQGLPF